MNWYLVLILYIKIMDYILEKTQQFAEIKSQTYIEFHHVE